MTAQEIFNEVWAKMAAQGVPSKWGTTCLYRGPNETACAVGCLLTDEEARGLDSPGNGASVTTVYHRGQLPERMVPHLALLSALQQAHDRMQESGRWIENFQARARRIAKRFNLTVPE